MRVPSVRNQPANAFSIAMATGIVAVAVADLGMSSLGKVLFFLDVALYVVLWITLAIRLLVYPREVRADVRSYARAPGFFAIVAATCLAGAGSTTILGLAPSLPLWLAGLAFWSILTYTVFAVLVFSNVKPTLPEGLNGGWLLIVVATQAVTVLGTTVAGAARPSAAADVEIFTAVCFWLAGGMLYLWLIGLIVYRFLFFPMAADEFAPPYWINMGAMSIATLAGVYLLRQAPSFDILRPIAAFIRGSVLLDWATATWWIPLLLTLSAWRYVRGRFALRYGPGNWSAVFPLGMYSVATRGVIDTLHVDFLHAISVAFGWAALAAWTVASGGLLRSLLFSARVRHADPGRAAGRAENESG